jgi:hypothetical protein
VLVYGAVAVASGASDPCIMTQAASSHVTKIAVRPYTQVCSLCKHGLALDTSHDHTCVNSESNIIYVMKWSPRTCASMAWPRSVSSLLSRSQASEPSHGSQDLLPHRLSSDT